MNSLLKKIELFEKLAKRGGKKSFLQSLGQETQDWAKLNPHNKIDPNVQKALNELFEINLTPDGVIGPQTASALSMYQDKYNDRRDVRDYSLHKDILSKTEPANWTVPHMPSADKISGGSIKTRI